MTFDLSSPAVSIPSFTLTVHVWWIAAWLAVGAALWLWVWWEVHAAVKGRGSQFVDDKFAVFILRKLKDFPVYSLWSVVSAPPRIVRCARVAAQARRKRRGERA